MEDSTLSDGAQQANLVSNENAEAMFGADQAETNMVKLVDGKLTPIGDTEDDVLDGQLKSRYSSDEERSLHQDAKPGAKTYENSEAALEADDDVNNEVSTEASDATSAIAVAEITGNPDAGATVNTGLPSEDAPAEQNDKSTPTNSFGNWNVIGNGHGPGNDMIPPTPGTPDPMQPVPGIPETPPYNPVPGPEIPVLPGTPQPATPEIQEPDQPDRSHEVNSQFTTFTASVPAPSGSVVPTNGPKPDGAVPETKYEGLDEGATAEPGSKEGMKVKPDTGESARPYDVNAKDQAEHKPGERPEEAKETRNMPRELADESSIMAQDMVSGSDRSDQKSTEGMETNYKDLDQKYNDPKATRDMAT